MEGSKVKLTFRFDEDLLREFKAQVALEGTNMTEVLHQIVRKWLDEKENRRRR
jgi:hypothetical protein